MVELCSDEVEAEKRRVLLRRTENVGGEDLNTGRGAEERGNCVSLGKNLKVCRPLD